MYDSDTNETANLNDISQNYEIANNIISFTNIIKNRKPIKALNSLNLKKNGSSKNKDDETARGYKFQYIEKENF